MTGSMREGEAGFRSEHTGNFAAILSALNISLAVTSYQAGRLCLLRSDGERVDTCFKAFPRPMGITADEQSITLGTFSKVLNFRRSDALLAGLHSGAWEDPDRLTRKLSAPESAGVLESQAAEGAPDSATYGRADALFVQRSAHHSGMINIHDIAWGDAGLWVVNSAFSCLCTLSADYSFVPRWKPPFISALAPEDRCHLNGMALQNGRPKYVTTFNRRDVRDSWRDSDTHEGTLIDVESNTILLDGLVMPHSPRVHRGVLYLCESGTGKLLRYSLNDAHLEVVAELPGFTRGMTFYGPLMFVGLSKVRSSDIRNPIPLSLKAEASLSGIWIFDTTNFQEVGHIRFEGDVDQLYDIAVLRNSVWPELIDFDHPRARHLFDYPDLSASAHP